LTTELRTKFVPHMEKLFDEDILLGKGWTTHESLRPLAYSTLADLVHHVRQSLPLSDLARAVALFSKNVHDESLPTSIQTMSCKLLLNLVECIKARSEQENAATGRELLMRMMEVFVLKFKTVAKLQLPVLMAKHKGLQQPQTPTITEMTIKLEPQQDIKPLVAAAIEVKTEDTVSTEKKAKFGFPASQAQNYTVADCRALVKTLVCGVKTITWGCTSTKTDVAVGGPGASPIAAVASNQPQKQFQPKETLVYIRLVKWAMEALDVYTLNTTPGTQGPAQGPVAPGQGGVGGPRAPPLQQTVRTKEEKEVLEHFAGVFSLLNPQTFKEVLYCIYLYPPFLEHSPNVLLRCPFSWKI
jgi:transformation/transcription domain-associated protein